MTTPHQAALATDDQATEHITPHLAPDSTLSPEKWSLEVLPHDATDLSPVSNAIGGIYVSMIPGETVEPVIEALKRIRAQGKTSVPHIAARNLESDKALRSVLIACATLDVHVTLDRQRCHASQRSLRRGDGSTRNRFAGRLRHHPYQYCGAPGRKPR